MAVAIATLFLLGPAQANKGPSQDSRESLAKVIAEAQNLSIEKGRSAGVQLLTKKQLDLKKEGSAHPKVQKALHQLSNMVLTEKGQREFSFGESLYYSGQPGSEQHYLAALKIEPDNLTFLMAQARLLLSLRRCKEARPFLYHPLYSNSLHTGLTELRLAEKICSAEFKVDEYMKEALAQEEASLMVRYFRLHRSMPTEDSISTRKMAMELRESQPDFPLAHYWIWKLIEVPSKTPATSGKKYVQLCRERGAHLRKGFKNFPDLCHYSDAVEKQLEASP